ncbi:MAG: hypothetical protein ACXAC8_15880 [Candidatus Hodarchaeales archaeon]|jgi:hypothetical protein
MSELEEMRKTIRIDQSQLNPEARKRFWRIVGEIKRQTSPDSQVVEIASEVRDTLYKQRLGSTKPIRIILPLWTVCGFGVVLSSLFFSNPDLIYLGMCLSWLVITVFTLGYLWIVYLSKKWRYTILIASVGGTVIGDLLLAVISIDLLVGVNRFLMIAAVPCFYLHGRWVGGKISSIQFDGVSQDIFYLPTLKINYQSYLLAQPPARQWIFFCGGIGTVVTFGIVATVQLIVFGDPLFYLFPIVLLFGEILDYLNLAGPLSGGEFHHLRRERKIIGDWKKRIEKEK